MREHGEITDMPTALKALATKLSRGGFVSYVDADIRDKSVQDPSPMCEALRRNSRRNLQKPAYGESSTVKTPRFAATNNGNTRRNRDGVSGGRETLDR